jgi:hypothetical protein
MSHHPTKATQLGFYADQVNRYLKEYPKDPIKREQFIRAKTGKVNEIAAYLGTEPNPTNFRHTLEKFKHRLEQLHDFQSEIRHSLRDVMGTLTNLKEDARLPAMSLAYKSAHDFLSQLKSQLHTSQVLRDAQDMLKQELKVVTHALAEKGVLSADDGQRIKKADVEGGLKVMLAAIEHYQEVLHKAASATSIGDLEALQILAKPTTRAGLRSVLEALAHNADLHFSKEVNNGAIFAELKKHYKLNEAQSEVDDLLATARDELKDTQNELHANLTAHGYQAVHDILTAVREQLAGDKHKLKMVTHPLAEQGVLSAEDGKHIKADGGADVLLAALEKYITLIDKAHDASSELDIEALQEFAKGTTRAGIRAVLDALAKKLGLQFDSSVNNATIFHELKKHFRPRRESELINGLEDKLRSAMRRDDFKRLADDILEFRRADPDDVFMNNTLKLLLPYAMSKTPDSWKKWRQTLSTLMLIADSKPLQNDQLSLGLTNVARLFDNLHRAGEDSTNNKALSKQLTAIQEADTTKKLMAGLGGLRDLAIAPDVVTQASVLRTDLYAALTKVVGDTKKLLSTITRRENAQVVDEFKSRLGSALTHLSRSEDKTAGGTERVRQLKMAVKDLHALLAELNSYQTKSKQKESLEDILTRAEQIKEFTPELVGLIRRIRPNTQDLDTPLYRLVLNHLLHLTSKEIKKNSTRDAYNFKQDLENIKFRFRPFEYSAEERVERHEDALDALASTGKALLETRRKRLQQATKHIKEIPNSTGRGSKYRKSKPGYDESGEGSSAEAVNNARLADYAVAQKLVEAAEDLQQAQQDHIEFSEMQKIAQRAQNFFKRLEFLKHEKLGQDLKKLTSALTAEPVSPNAVTKLVDSVKKDVKLATRNNARLAAFLRDSNLV